MSFIKACSLRAFEEKGAVWVIAQGRKKIVLLAGANGHIFAVDNQIGAFV